MTCEGIILIDLFSKLIFAHDDNVMRLCNSGSVCGGENIPVLVSGTQRWVKMSHLVIKLCIFSVFLSENEGKGSGGLWWTDLE
jgi:hypothetical protein